MGKLADEAIESDEAAELVQLAIELERLSAAVRLMAARSVDSDHWRARGHRSAAAWMAAEPGLPAGPAIAAMETLRRLDDLPATAAAFREGRLSLAQVSEIPGVVPIPVSVARRMATDSILKVIVTKGVEMIAVARAGRTIRTASPGRGRRGEV